MQGTVRLDYTNMGSVRLDNGHKQSPGWMALARRGALAGLGVIGLALGVLPYLAARRVLYPLSSEPLPTSSLPSINVEADVEPEWVRFATRDGKELSGWFIPAPEGTPAPWGTILLVHGYGGYKEQMAGYAQIVHAAGFASFLFDMHGSGLRRDEPVSLGFKERWDLLDALDYLTGRPDVDGQRIGVLGVSMGAATALLAAADEPRIRAVVADSSYATLDDMVTPGIRTFVGKSALVLAPLIVFYAETMLGMRAADVRPAEAAARLGARPLLVIHGADDVLTDPRSAQRIYAAASGPKELWVVPNCSHAAAPSVAYDQYKRRIISFFTRWL